MERVFVYFGALPGDEEAQLMRLSQLMTMSICKDHYSSGP